ncbi:MAG: hypothetical protein ABIH70_02715 [Chloroflexota bacterium]
MLKGRALRPLVAYALIISSLASASCTTMFDPGYKTFSGLIGSSNITFKYPRYYEEDTVTNNRVRLMIDFVYQNSLSFVNKRGAGLFGKDTTAIRLDISAQWRLPTKTYLETQLKEYRNWNFSWLPLGSSRRVSNFKLEENTATAVGEIPATIIVYSFNYESTPIVVREVYLDTGRSTVVVRIDSNLSNSLTAQADFQRILQTFKIQNAVVPSESYAKYSLDEGIAHFSMVYPSSYELLHTDIRNDAQSKRTELEFMRKPLDANAGVDSLIIFVEPIGTFYKDSKAALDKKIYGTLHGPQGTFTLIKSAGMSVAGAQGEKAVYTSGSPYRRLSLVIYFDYKGLTWSIYMNVASTTPESVAEAEFDHILNTFKFLN